jgi:hypothetical protein
MLAQTVGKAVRDLILLKQVRTGIPLSKIGGGGEQWILAQQYHKPRRRFSCQEKDDGGVTGRSAPSLHAISD